MTTETRTQLPDRWTVEDIRYLLEKLDDGPILVSGHELGLPTIHDFSDGVVHLGFGLFEVRAPAYTLGFSGGGAMERTPSGQTWSPLRIEGEYAYDCDGVRATLQGYLENGAGEVEDKKVGDEDEPGPAGYVAGKGSAYDYVPDWMEVPALYSTADQDDRLAIIKLFTPDSSWTWYIIEYDAQEDVAFGLVAGFETEFGYFPLSEIREARGPLGLQIERELWFEPVLVTQLPEYRAKWGHDGPCKGQSDPTASQSPPDAEVEAEDRAKAPDPPAQAPAQLHQESKAPLTGDKLLTTNGLPKDKKSLRRRLKQARKDLKQKRGGMDVAFDVALNDGGASLKRLEAEIATLEQQTHDLVVALNELERSAGDMVKAESGQPEPGSAGYVAEVEDKAKVSDPPAWTLTRLCYQESKALTAGGVPILNAADGREHERLVREAEERGEDVPDHVLTDYPDLVKTHYRHPHDDGATLCSRPIGDETRVSHDAAEVDCGECLCYARRGHDMHGQKVSLSNSRPGESSGPDEAKSEPLTEVEAEKAPPDADDTPARLAPVPGPAASDDWTPAPEDQAEFERWDLELLTGSLKGKSSPFYRALKRVARPGTLRLALLQVNGNQGNQGERRRELIEKRLAAMLKQQTEPEAAGTSDG